MKDSECVIVSAASSHVPGCTGTKVEITNNSNRKEPWIKPEVLVLSVMDSTLGGSGTGEDANECAT
jgi:hypothetical protein